MDWLEYHEEPVTLHSGATSHWLVRGDLLFADEHIREIVLNCWAFAISLHSPGLRDPCIFGIPRGGTPWAEALAKRLPDARLLDNYTTTPHDPVFLVDDVCTTGESFEAYPLGPRLVVVRRTQRYSTVQVTARWMDVQLPIEKEE